MLFYSYFQGVCRDLFAEFIEKTRQVCMEKMMEELLCNELIYWDSSSIK
jgi:hypothetical protein